MYRCRAWRVPGASGSSGTTGKSANASSYAAQIFLPAPKVLLHAGELMDADRSLEIHHVVLEARLDDFVMLEAFVGEALPGIRRKAVEGKTLDPGCIGLRGGRDHSALARDDVLGRVEAEGGEVAERPGMAIADERLDRVRAILDHRQPALAREGDDVDDVARSSREVHRNHRARAIRRTALDLLGRHAHRLPVDVREHRNRTRVDDRVCGRRERHCRHDHLVARTEVERHHCQMQGGGARVDRDRVPGLDVRPEGLFEAPDPGPVPIQAERKVSITSSISGSSSCGLPKTR